MPYTYTKKKKKELLEDGIISSINDYGIDVEHRELFLFPREEYSYGAAGDEVEGPGVEYSMANQFIRNLRLLSRLSDEPILIHLKTNGGEWDEGLAMYQAMKACPNYLVMVNYASARSMSSIIFSAADYRAMLPLSTFMIHTGTMGFYGTGTQVDTEYEEKIKADRIMNEIYIEKLRESDKFKGKTDKQIDTWLRKTMKQKEEVYFSAEESLEYNWADTVFGADGTYDWSELIKV